VCRRHGLSLSHEDCHGAFIVENYSKDNIEWLKDARNEAAEPPVTITMDLTRSTQMIQVDLCARWPFIVNLWWELDEGEQTGTVWDSNRVLAKLLHAGTEQQVSKSSTGVEG
jgi:hypothetical protein